MTHQEFVNRVNEQGNGDYEVLGEYKNRRTKILLKHKVCGWEYEAFPNTFSSGGRCPKCSGLMKLTQEEYENKITELTNGEFVVIGEYINSHTKILMRHNICNHEWMVFPQSLIVGKSCPNCASNSKRTTEYYKTKVKELTGDEYMVLGEYVANNVNVKMAHRVCGQEFEPRPSDFLRGSRCPICSKRPEENREKFEMNMRSLTGDEYKLIDGYTNIKTKVLLKHNKCGLEYKTKPINFLGGGGRCPVCVGRVKKTHEEFVFKMKCLVGEEYVLLSEYINDSEKISLRHNKCGRLYSVTANSFVHGSRCAKCSGVLPLDQKEFEKRVRKAVGKEYTVLGDYKTRKKPILMRHNKCGHEWGVTPNNFLDQSSRCPRCNESKGEKEVKRILEDRKYNFLQQYRFNDCKDQITLAFDFALMNNDEVLCLIEYQGEQHYRAVGFFGGEEGFKKSQRRDNIKRDYCKRNKIPLIEVPYYEKDVEGYLENELNKVFKKIKGTYEQLELLL